MTFQIRQTRFCGNSKLVYVKPIVLDELPDEVREKVNGQGPFLRSTMMWANNWRLWLDGVWRLSRCVGTI